MIGRSIAPFRSDFLGGRLGASQTNRPFGAQVYAAASRDRKPACNRLDVSLLPFDVNTQRVH